MRNTWSQMLVGAGVILGLIEGGWATSLTGNESLDDGVLSATPDSITANNHTFS